MTLEGRVPLIHCCVHDLKINDHRLALDSAIWAGRGRFSLLHMTWPGGGSWSGVRLRDGLLGLPVGLILLWGPPRWLGWASHSTVVSG